MYTLWRGPTLLGHFTERTPVKHPGERVGASGFLQPTAAFVGVTSMMQTRSRIFPGQPYFQSPLAFPEVSDSLRAVRVEEPMELHRLSEEEARGVPPELVFTVRDANGDPIDATMVWLQRQAIPENEDPALLAKHGLTANTREIWIVMFSTNHNSAP